MSEIHLYFLKNNTNRIHSLITVFRLRILAMPERKHSFLREVFPYLVVASLAMCLRGVTIFDMTVI